MCIHFRLFNGQALGNLLTSNIIFIVQLIIRVWVQFQTLDSHTARFIQILKIKTCLIEEKYDVFYDYLTF